MKSKVEAEMTYFTNDFTLDTREFIEELCTSIDNQQVIFRYNDRIEFLVDGQNHDKTKITFKINHGNIYYRIATKNRLSSPEEIIQTFQEQRTDWSPIEEIDISIFNNRIISFYYKEINKVKAQYKNKKIKIIGQDVQFLTLSTEVKKTKKYIEIESDSFDSDQINFFADYLCRNDFKLIYNNSKWKVGKRVLGNDNQLLISSILDLKEFIYKLYIKMSVHHLVR